jgi:hypothetical protein
VDSGKLGHDRFHKKKFSAHSSALRAKVSSVTISTSRMNPDKLFDYLDGRLPDWERSQLEEQLLSDSHLRRELEIARQIHARTRGELREVLLENQGGTAERGRKMALRVGTAFIFLMGLNVAFGLWLIARHETANPNRKLLETRMRDQIMKSLEHATHETLTPPPLDVSDITIAVARGRLDAVADQVVSIAKRLGGSATKELPDPHRLGVLVDIPANKEVEFRSAIATISGGAPTSAPPSGSTGEGAEKKSFVVQIVEATQP